MVIAARQTGHQSDARPCCQQLSGLFLAFYSPAPELRRGIISAPHHSSEYLAMTGNDIAVRQRRPQGLQPLKGLA